MYRFLVLRVLFTLALLSGGVTSAAYASPGTPAADTELLPTDIDSAPTALPSGGLGWLSSPGDVDGRSVRFGDSAPPARERVHAPKVQAPGVSASLRKAFHSDVGARLLRGGIHSSTLGTPPPQS